MPKWMQCGSIYNVQPTREVSESQLKADWDKLMANLAAAKANQMTEERSA
ncbi:hypothetical protein NCCP2222_02100 [Sporosarcina sp. NCCP-2222]|nr:hypothetical protein [Sporosarcina sp. NCCP-2222]GKV54263.1 hypothetical protein NCCP2222_02100 [Sporosarcina sp. NCCP-2222]